MLKEIWQSTCTTLYAQKWLNQLLAFSYKSGDLGPLNGIILGMFSLVKHKIMEPWSISFGQLTLYKGHIHIPSSKTLINW